MARRTELLARIKHLVRAGRVTDLAMLIQELCELGLPPDARLFTAWVQCNVAAGDMPGACAVVRQMRVAGFVPSTLTLNLVLRGCKQNQCSPACVRRVLQSMPGLTWDTYTWNTLLGIMKQQRATWEVVRLWREMPWNLKDVVTCNTMLYFYAQRRDAAGVASVRAFMATHEIQGDHITAKVLARSNPVVPSACCCQEQERDGGVSGGRRRHVSVLGGCPW